MTDKMPLGRRDFFVGEKELLDLTVKELREELGKRRLDKRGRKLVLQDRLYDALADEEWSEMTVSHWHLAVCRCELPRLHRESMK